MYRIFSFQLWECLEIFLRYSFGDALLKGGIDQRHTTALEACARKASAVDAVGLCHDLIKSLQLGRTGFPVVNGGLAALEGQSAVLLDIATSPRLSTALNAIKLGVPVLGTP